MRNSRRALTILEIMISVTIFAVVIAIPFTMFSDSEISWRSVTDHLYFEHRIKTVLDTLTADLELSRLVVLTLVNDPTPPVYDSIQFMHPLIQGNRIDLVGGQLAWGVGANVGWSILYRVDAANNLIREVLDGGSVIQDSRVLLTNISHFDCLPLGTTGVVRITLETSPVIGRRTVPLRKYREILLEN